MLVHVHERHGGFENICFERLHENDDVEPFELLLQMVLLLLY